MSCAGWIVHYWREALFRKYDPPAVFDVPVTTGDIVLHTSAL